MTGRVAVLGGTGWVGRHVCAAFTQRGREVLAVARTDAPHLSAHRFLPCDLAAASTGSMAALLRSERVDIVVNATDSTNTKDGWDRTESEHREVNVAVVERLLAAAGALPWRVRIVHLGTIHEYGPVPPGTAIGESRPTRPATSYARSKLAGSQAVLRAGAVDGVVLRLVNLCGPHPSPDSFPGKLLRSLRGGATEVTIADAKRDFVDVRDVAEAVVRAAAAPTVRGVVNIGSGVPVEIGELVRMFLAEAGATGVEIRRGPVRSLGGDWTQADITLARTLLGWEPRIGLRHSLRDMWQAAR
jgi:nucleoside-diphosphate-sugar epimerase